MDYISYVEKRKHGTAAFPIQYYYVDKSHPRYVMNAHWHREFEIIRVLSGSLTVYLNNSEYDLKENDVLFVGCGVLHRGQPTDCAYECIVVDLKMLLPQQSDTVERYVSPLISSQVNIRSLLSSSDPELYQAVVGLFTSMSGEKQYYELSVYGLLYSLIFRLHSDGYISPSSPVQSSRQIEQVGAILDWINGNFKEPINSQRLSRISNLNFNYLCKIFKSITGQTITQYVNEQRIEHACYDIAEKNKTVTEAAFSNGFNDLSYFAKTFRRYKKMTPREFKALASAGKAKNDQR